MASEDVIELGSSDDETEPAPKKSKPLPNAMVCIPRKLHEVTIKPAKLNLALASKGLVKGVPIPKATLTPKEILTPKGITVSRVPNISINPFANRTKSNGKPVQNRIVKPQHTKLTKPIPIQKPPNSNLTFAASFIKNPIKISNTKPITKLPPSITVKRTTQVLGAKPVLITKSASLVKSKIQPKQVNEVPTVELDDDEGPAISSSPAWYLRPEEQTPCSEATTTSEQENNKEPEPSNMIEITIEDSPIKPVLNKRTCEVGAELAITIDDSPVKLTADKNASPSGSDDETRSSREPNSKKKLQYPKEAENQDRKTVEIEIEIPPLVVLAKDNKIQENNVEITPELSIDNNVSTEKNTKNTDAITANENKQDTGSSTRSEFHPVYQSFIDLCFQLENSDDMKKIVEKKIEAYYRQVPKEYTESEEFIDMVASKIHAMKASPEKMYLFIKDIVDELNMHRKMAKAQIINKEVSEVEESKQSYYNEESEYDSKRQRQIRKLEKTIKKLHRAIQKLEEQEVDFDDEDDSVYLLTERYKERMVRVYAKFCQLTNTKMPSEPRIIIDARPGQPSGPAKRLEKWINKKVPIGTPLPFPDFHDVLRCVREANDEDKLFWNEADIMEEARDLFVRCGKKLQRRRQENEWRLAASRIAAELDPAEQNEHLKCKLEENRKIAANKETEIFNKYADRQNQLKLEAVEIGDKEADESPVESEEEEANDESVSLENKAKRKERLKRLLHEKSRRASEGKENQLAQGSNEISEAECKISETNQEVTTKKLEPDVNENKDDPEKIIEKSVNIGNIDNKSPNPPETLSISDDSYNLESDIDELHLLQKLHSENEAQSSTLESSDSESPIAISDSLESGSDSKKQLSDDVISIENSSYSETEVDKVDKPLAGSIELIGKDKKQENIVHAGMETESSNVDLKIGSSGSVLNSDKSGSVQKVDNINAIKDSLNTNAVLATETTITSTENVLSKTNNDEYNECVENILLASSDDEIGGSQESIASTEGACVNLRDELISIDETVIGSVVDKPEKELNVTTSETVSVDTPSKGEMNTNDAILGNDKAEERLNSYTSMDTSQNEVLSAPTEESAHNNALHTDENVENMDIDHDETLKQSESTPSEEETVSITLSSETQ